MIHIEVSDRSLVAAIRKKRPRWFKDAKEKSAAARLGGKVGEKDGIWSEIKEVYILLQEFKCIYCEHPLPKIESASAARVTVDYDVEHFRPQNRVTPWPTSSDLERRPRLEDYRAQVASGNPTGYLRLAFDPFNYVVSCKVCNSSYKADRFPIAGKPDRRSRKRFLLDGKEKPLLLFPFGEHGDDPARFLTFEGPTIGPCLRQGLEGLRGRAVIDFFELDTREGLLEGRCWLIQILWPQLENRSSPEPQKKARAEAFLRTVQERHRHLHTACGRAFIDLYQRNRPRAQVWYDAAVQYLTSKDPAVFQQLG